MNSVTANFARCTSFLGLEAEDGDTLLVYKACKRTDEYSICDLSLVLEGNAPVNWKAIQQNTTNWSIVVTAIGETFSCKLSLTAIF